MTGTTRPTTRPARPRHRWGFVVAIVLLVCLPIAEVWLLIQVGHQIGVGPTLLVLVVEAVLGAWLIRREGAKAWAALAKAYGNGRLPSGELADAALVLVGGALLVLPGFFTDVLGVFFLLPFTRPLARRSLGFLIARRVAAMGAEAQSRSGVIAGETVDVPPAGEPTDPRVIRGEVDER